MLSTIMNLMPKDKLVSLAGKMTSVIEDMSENPLTNGNPVTIIARKTIPKSINSKRVPEVMFCYKNEQGSLTPYQKWNKEGAESQLDFKGRSMIKMILPIVMKLIDSMESEKNEGRPMEFHIHNKDMDGESTAHLDLIKLIPTEEDGKVRYRRELEEGMKFSEIVNLI